MADDRYLQHTFPNGMTLLAERMPAVRSAAMSLMVPAGSVTDPDDRSGAATVLSDMILRGAGDRDNKQLTDHLDGLGLQRSSGAGLYHSRLGAAALADKVVEGLATYADIVRRPQLPEDGFEAAQDLALQSLAGIDDEPRQKLLIELREWHFPSPYGRNSMGEPDQIEQMTVEFCREDHARRFHPDGAILAVAGNVDFGQLKGEVEKHFGDWTGTKVGPAAETPPPGDYHHVDQQSEQTHIGIAYPSVPETDPDYYLVRIAIEILSGGMSGRLFTEVREKRGLVYSVWAGYTGLADRGSIFAYAGTSNERAQATLDCLTGELHRMSQGVTEAELARAKTGIKASTIMSNESTGSRSGTIAHDFFIRGRIRSVDEIKAAIDGVTVEAVNAYLATHPAGPFTIVTVGPKELTRP